MWHIGTRFKGSAEKGLRECVVNFIHNNHMSWCVVRKGQPMTPPTKGTRGHQNMEEATGLVKRGTWVIISQPFEVYLNEIER